MRAPRPGDDARSITAAAPASLRIGAPMNTSERNAAIVRRFIDEYQVAGNAAAFAELVHPEFVDHTRPPGVSLGPDGIREQFDAFRSVLADFTVRVVVQSVDGDLVTTHKIFSGDHVGAFLGIPASGQRVDLPVIDMIRLRDGRIAEHWGVLGIAPLLFAASVAAEG